jgi:dsRNA-specific ribonuclease
LRSEDLVNQLHRELISKKLGLFTAARVLGLPERSLYRWISRQTIPTPGSELLIRRGLRRLKNLPSFGELHE